MRYLALLALVALSACATDQTPPPAVQIKPVPQIVEVQRPCQVTVPARPAPLAKPYPTDALQLAAFLGAKLAEYSGPGGYAERADAALRTCSKPQP